MPIGSGRDQVLPAYQLSEGLLTDGASGATAWNPLDSGRTFLELRPFYRTQNIENDDIDEEQSTNGTGASVSSGTTATTRTIRRAAMRSPWS